MMQAGIVESGAGNVRLLKRAELAAGWDWWTDERPTIWEGTQHLIRRLKTRARTAPRGSPSI